MVATVGRHISLLSKKYKILKREKRESNLSLLLLLLLLLSCMKFLSCTKSSLSLQATSHLSLFTVLSHSMPHLSLSLFHFPPLMEEIFFYHSNPSLLHLSSSCESSLTLQENFSCTHLLLACFIFHAFLSSLTHASLPLFFHAHAWPSPHSLHFFFLSCKRREKKRKGGKRRESERKNLPISRVACIV